MAQTEIIDRIDGQVELPPLRLQVVVFIFVFLALVADGLDQMLLAYSMQSLKTEFGLDNVQVGSFASFTLVGMALGGMFSGWCCDRFGRVRTITWGIAIFSIFTASLGFTHHFWQFAVLRLIGAIGLGGVYSSCFILLSEYMPAKYRATILGSAVTGYSLGFILAAFLAGQIIPNHGWRPLFFITIIPIVLCLFLRRLIPEPPSYRLAREKLKAGERKAQEQLEKSLFIEALKDKKLRLVFFVWLVGMCFGNFGYYGVSNWTPSYLEKELGMHFKSMTTYMIGSYFTMFLGKILTGIAADIVGRRWLNFAAAIGTAGFLFVILKYHTAENIVYLLLAFGFVYGMTIGALGTYITESFPTKIRGIAVGIAYNFGRFGGAVAPVVIGAIANGWSIGMGMFTICAAYIIVATLLGTFVRDRMYDPQREA